MQYHYLSFYKKVLELGFTTEKYFEAGSLCMAKKNNSIIFSPDEKAYKCLSLVGVTDGIVGNLNSSLEIMKNHFNINLYEDCFKSKCEFIPMCHTGCRYKSFINNGIIDSRDCNYNELKKINTQILKTIHKL